MNFTTGKKTYTAAGAIVLGSVAAWLHGDINWQNAIFQGLQGLTLIFLRNGMATETQK